MNGKFAILAELAGWIKEKLKVHGVPFLAMGVLTWFFYTEHQELEADVRLCNERLVNKRNHQFDTMVRLLERNQIMMERILKKLEHED